MRRNTLLLVLLLSAAMPAESGAGPWPSGGWQSPQDGRANVSYSIWTVAGDEVMLRFLLPAYEAQTVVGRGPAVVTTTRLAEYLLQHTAVAAAGRNCPAQDQGYGIGRVDPLAARESRYGFEISFLCPRALDLTFEDSAVFDRSPGHVNFARIEIKGRAFLQLFTSGRRRISASKAGIASEAGFTSYVSLGARHVLYRMDLVCFLLGVLLYVRRRQGLPAVMIGLCAGYALTAAIVLPDWLAPRTTAAGAFIGFWVAFPGVWRISGALRERGGAIISAVGLLLAIGAYLVHRADAALILAGSALLAGGMLARSEQEPDSRLLAALPAFCVGLADGCSLPEVLRPLDLGAAAKIPMLGGFDLGALLAACVLLLAAAAAGRIVQGRRDPADTQILTDVTIAVVGGLGTFWFISGLPG